MSDFLREMAQASRARAKTARSSTGPHPQLRPLNRQRFDLIAEVKLQAPSTGVLATPHDPLSMVVTQAQAYAAGGAAALSVLTEPSRFGGSLDHLQAVAEAVELPVMRKDFLVDPIQVHEARAAGASGVLLILGILDDAALTDCLEAAADLGLFVLLEAFDSAELRRAAPFLGPGILLGLNCRDLRTLAVVPDRLCSMAGSFPEGAVRVAESGLRSPGDIQRVAASGYSLALVGSALMQTPDPEHLVAQMLLAGRSQENVCASA